MRSVVVKSICVLFVLLAVVPAANAYHPFYVSVTEMKYNSTNKALEISCKMFAEDIEDILKQNYKQAVDLTNNQQADKNNKLVKDYMNRHLSISIDSKPVAFNFVGFEKDKESVYCYLEITGLTPFKKLSVNNTILYEFKDEQISIIHFIDNGKRQSTKLDNPKNVAVFTVQ